MTAAGTPVSFWTYSRTEPRTKRRPAATLSAAARALIEMVGDKQSDAG